MKRVSIGGEGLFIDDVSFHRPVDTAFLLITPEETGYFEGDFDRDGTVGVSDLARLAEDLGRPDCYDTGDGDVSRSDRAGFAAE